jgi:hypothetical protein
MNAKIAKTAKPRLPVASFAPFAFLGLVTL